MSIFSDLGQALLSARASRLRDWGLFALAAIVPTAAVGALGLRAVSSEEAAILRQAETELEVSVERVERQVEEGIGVGADALARRSFPTLEDPAELEAALRSVTPAFADPIALHPDRRLAVPRAPEPAASESPSPPVASASASASASAEVRARCDELARAYASDGDGAVRAKGRAGILESCREARTESGRWLWPLAALDGLSQEEAPAFSAWIRDHASRMRAPERAATRAEIERLEGFAPETKAEWQALLAGETRGRAAIERLLEDRAVLAAMADVDGDRIEWRAGASRGILHRDDSGALVGFIIHEDSLRRALVRGSFALLPDQAASVEKGVEPEGSDHAAGGPSRRHSRLVARARIAPELVIQLRLLDPEVAARASTSRAILAGLAGGAMMIAFGVAALLFARMRAARRSSELRTGFVAAVSHELRTPIASIRMLAELLEQGRIEPAEQGEVHEALARESKRLGETVDRLLGFSRMAAGRATAERASVRIAEVIGASIDTHEERHPEAPPVERRLDPDLDASVDAGQIRLAVDNLLANAHKYAPDGAPYEVTARRRDGGLAISVRDHGPGIPRRDHKRIFQPFERVDDRLSRATEGSGIGLSLVAEVVRAHGGVASLESDVGRGATFTLWIPDEEGVR